MVRKKVVIFGAGGHGREVADIITAQAQAGEPVEPHGFIDENPALKGHIIDGLPVLGGWEWFAGVDRHELLVVAAFGTPAVMKKVIEKAKSLGLTLGKAISPQAFVSPHARLSPGVTLFPHTFVSTQAVLETGVSLNVAATVSHDSVVGPYTVIAPGAHIGGNVKIGEGAFLGIGCTVNQGLSIGDWSIIGGSAAVVRNIPSYVTAVGVPARPIKKHLIET